MINDEYLTIEIRVNNYLKQNQVVADGILMVALDEGKYEITIKSHSYLKCTKMFNNFLHSDAKILTFYLRNKIEKFYGVAPSCSMVLN